MIKKGVCVVLLFLFVVSFVYASLGLEVSSLLLKVSLNKGESVAKSFTITSKEGDAYSLNVVSVPGASLSGDNFILSKGEKKTVDVIFNSTDLEPGIYVGSIDITSPKETLSLPVILEIESRDVFFDVNLDIPPAYTEILPGGRLIAQIKVFDLTSGGGTSEGVDGVGTSSVDIEYNIFDLRGNLLSSESERLVVDKQAQVTKTFGFPEELSGGDYVVGVAVKYGSSVGVSSQMFTIEEKEVTNAPSLKFFDLNSAIVLVLILVFTFSVVFLFIYIIRDRDKLIADLKRYHYRELKMQREMLERQVRFLKSQGVYGRDVKREVSRKIEALKREQKKRVMELKELKRRGDIGEMRKKIREWERKGYDVDGLKYKLKGLSVKDMKSLMRKWKKEGYK